MIERQQKLGKRDMIKLINELLQKAKTYPKTEEYLRNLDRQRIDEGKDVPVTKREKVVRQADENAAKRLEAQGKSISIEKAITVDRHAKKPIAQIHDPELGEEVGGGTIHETKKRIKMTDFDPSKGEIEEREIKDKNRPGNMNTKRYGIDEIKRSIDDQTAEYFVKCHSHVLFGDTEDGLKGKKKEAPKAKDHVFGSDPKDKRGSEYEMVKKKEPDAYKSEESDLMKAIDDLVEKAVYGAGARGGKVERGSHKDTPAHSKARSVNLSPEKKKEIEERSRAKARTQASTTGLYGQASKLKSIDDRTIDYLEKARQTNEGGDDPRKEENPEKWKKTGDKNAAMHAGIKPKVPKNVKKSLDERTIDLVKALTSDREKEIHSAVSKVRMIKHGVEGAEKITAKPEDVVRTVRTHNAIAARTQKSICDKWQDSPFVTKGARVLPTGPGGLVSDLVKDDKEDDDQGAE